jgi:hypothetical protein
LHLTSPQTRAFLASIGLCHGDVELDIMRGASREEIVEVHSYNASDAAKLSVQEEANKIRTRKGDNEGWPLDSESWPLILAPSTPEPFSSFLFDGSHDSLPAAFRGAHYFFQTVVSHAHY